MSAGAALRRALADLTKALRRSGATARQSKDPHRPRCHVTPRRGWLNDPCGLHVVDGEYHLFYQCFPHAPLWGPMHWGHAVSRDLLHWEERPIALRPDPTLGFAFTGSAVLADRDTFALAPADHGGVVPVLVLTHSGGTEGGEKQSVAWTADGGRTFDLANENPVLRDPNRRDFRDPHVQWFAPERTWVMVVAAGHELAFYRSQDLVRWEATSVLDVAPPEGGVWEVPVLVRLPIEGPDGGYRWVLKVDANRFLAGPSRAYYLVGDFDGRRFSPDDDTLRRVDHGADFYAAQPWAGASEPMWTGWMASWDYALMTPTNTWRGVLSLPRTLALRGGAGEALELVQRPAPAVAGLRQRQVVRLRDEPLRPGGRDLLAGVRGRSLEIWLRVTARGARRVAVTMCAGEGVATVLSWEPGARRLVLDRRRSGEVGFHRAFSAQHEALVVSSEVLELHVFVDCCTVEVFAEGGRVVLSDLIFPGPDADGFSLGVEGGAAHAMELDVFELAETADDARAIAEAAS